MSGITSVGSVPAHTAEQSQFPPDPPVGLYTHPVHVMPAGGSHATVAAALQSASENVWPAASPYPEQLPATASQMHRDAARAGRYVVGSAKSHGWGAAAEQF